MKYIVDIAIAALFGVGIGALWQLQDTNPTLGTAVHFGVSLILVSAVAAIVWRTR